jgi:hypothetical protein
MNETTKLQAINTMLSCIGESPVSTLTSTHTADVSVAQNILDEVCRELMSRNWSWNTVTKQTLTPDLSGQISVPSSWVRVEHPLKDYAKKGNYLYDRENETYTFGAAVSDLKAIQLLEWEDMPESARRYCMIRAGRTLAGRMVTSEKAVQFTERDELQAFMLLREYESEQADYNIFRNTSVAAASRRYV